MNKRITLISILLVSILTGCSLAENFQSAREEYLETRVVELLDEMAPAGDEAHVEPIVTEVEAAAEDVEETVEPTEEVTQEATEAATEEPTEEVTEEATADATEAAEEDSKSLSPDPAVYSGEPDWVDDMAGTGYWPTSTDEYLSATYENETLEIVALSEINGWRIATTEILDNVYIEATVKVGECSGKDGYGIIFRVPDKVDYQRGYLFGLTCDGNYNLRSFDGLKGEYGEMISLQSYTASELVNKGEDQTNRLGIMAVDDRLIMYINGEKVGEVSDDTYDEGFFGIFINRENTEELTINVDDVQYWLDPTAK